MLLPKTSDLHVEIFIETQVIVNSLTGDLCFIVNSFELMFSHDDLCHSITDLSKDDVRVRVVEIAFLGGSQTQFRVNIQEEICTFPWTV